MRLRFVLRERDVRGAIDEQVLSVYRDHGVVRKADRDDNFNKTPEDLSLYKLVLQGDVVVNKMKAWQGSLAVSDYRGIVSGDYLVCAVVGQVEHRYMHHLLRSRHMIDEYALRSKGIRPSQWRLYWEDLADVEVEIPPLPEQRAIADFLDRETARIDALIAAKRRMIEVLEEEYWASVSEVVWAERVRAVPLMRRTQSSRPIMYGIVLPGPDVADGVPIVKGGDVAAKRLSPEHLNRTTREIEAPFKRARLTEHDLVFAIRGGIGDVEVVPAALAGANITQDVARVAPAADVNPAWLRLTLKSHQVRGQVEQRTTGATVRGLNIFELKRILVPDSDRARQARDLDILETKGAAVDRLLRHLDNQIELLAEHRQALITAAVTGELDVRRAA